MSYFCTTSGTSATSTIDAYSEGKGIGHVNQGRCEQAEGGAKKTARAGVLRRGRIIILAQNLSEEQEKPTHTNRTKEGR